MATCNGRFNTAGEVYMVVFQQNHIEQPDTMIDAATNFNRFFFDHAQARSCLTRIQYACFRSFQCFDIFACRGCNTTHALHDIEHQAFRLQQRLYLTFDYESDIAFLHFGSVVDECRHFQIRIECVENTFSHFDPGQYAVFLHDQLALTHFRSRNTT